MERFAKLDLGDKTIELPIIEGSEGEKGIDISKLRTETGYISYDPGYGNTGSCSSSITYIDGEKGILRYRGIPIEEFDRDKPDFLEAAYLLIFGKLPNQTELDDYKSLVRNNEHLHEAMKHHFEGFPTTAPPMAMLSAMINTMSCFHPELLERGNDKNYCMAASSADHSRHRSRGRPPTASRSRCASRADD